MRRVRFIAWAGFSGVVLAAGVCALVLQLKTSGTPLRQAGEESREIAVPARQAEGLDRPALTSAPAPVNPPVELDLELCLADPRELSRAARIAEVSRRQEQEELEAKEESTDESIRNLASKTYTLCSPVLDLTTASEEYFRQLREVPRVRKLLRIATQGSVRERKAMSQRIAQMCEAYVEDLPDFGIEGMPWRPSAMHPGGGIAYAYLLTHVDDSASTLSLIVDMHLRQQSAARKYFGQQSSDWICCEHGMVLAYASDHFLRLYCSREDLRAGVTPAQAKVLQAYEVYVDNRSRTEWDWFSEQISILEFAVGFVHAGNQEHRE